MPYFVYQIAPPMRLTHLDTKDRYRDARTLVRHLRQERSPAEMLQYRLVFANNQAEAEKLLSRPRDEGVFGED